MADAATIRSAADPQWSRQIRAALDGARVHDAMQGKALGDLLGARDILSVNCERVHTGSALGIVVDYAVDVRDGSGKRRRLRAFGQIPAGDPVATLAQLHMRLAPAAGVKARPVAALLADLGMILRPAGIDERIDGLWLLDPARHEAPHPELTPLAQPNRRAATLLAHRLGKRAVLKLECDAAGAPASVLKLYKRKSQSVPEVARLHRNLADHFAHRSDSIATPPLLATLATAKGLLMRAVPAEPLSALAGAERHAGMRLAGEALAHLHAAPLDRLQPYDQADELRLLRTWIAFISALSPDIGATFEAGLDRVAAAFAGCRSYRPVPIHRDYHERQVLYRTGQLTMLDFDTLRSGDPAQDVGNFLAHLRLAELRSGATDAQSVASFDEGYRLASHAASISDENISAHRRATLLRLAILNWFNESARHLVAPLVGEV